MTIPEPEPKPENRRKFLILAVVLASGPLIYGGQFLAQQQGWMAKGSMGGAAIAVQMEDYFEAQAPGLQLIIDCPSEIPIQKAKTTDCTARNQNGRESVLFVTVTDLDGHFRYELADPSILVP